MYLALSFSIIRNFTPVEGTAFDYPAFWKNSLVGAVANRLIMKRVIPAMAEDAFAVGLLRNIGMLVLNQSLPQQYRLVVEESQRTGCDQASKLNSHLAPPPPLSAILARRTTRNEGTHSPVPIRRNCYPSPPTPRWGRWPEEVSIRGLASKTFPRADARP